MKEADLDVPLGKKLVVGIVYNLKSNHKYGLAVDSEAEYDSISTVNAIKAALEKCGHKVVLLEANMSLPQKLKNSNIDVAFNIAEGRGGRGREAQIPSLLDYYSIPYTGSDETTLCVALDKALTKQLVTTHGIKTPKFSVVADKNGKIGPKIKFPVIVKPNAEGSSKGISDISIAADHNALKSLISRNIDLYSSEMLVEEYVEGREFTVGLLGNGADVKVFEPMEIIFKKETQDDYHVYSYTVKQNYTEYVEYKCPPELSVEKSNELKRIALKVFKVLNCKDFSRVDFRMSPDGVIHFIEINPLPGLAPNYSDFPMLAEFCGIKYTDLVGEVLNVAVKRIGEQAIAVRQKNKPHFHL